ncbi:MAG: nucleotide kinase domain-containing protein [Vicinamibacterales bacterium]
MTATPGHLYIFEGADGVGKSALSERFANELRATGIRCELLAFPGRSPGTLGSLVYQIHHQPEAVGINAVTPQATQLLHVAAHVDALQTEILPLLNQGITVVLDRYWWSTVVDGLVAGIPRSTIDLMVAIELAGWRGVRPTAAFLVERDTPLRPEPTELWTRWCSHYRDLAEQETSDYPVHRITNDDSVDAAVIRIQALLSGAHIPATPKQETNDSSQPTTRTTGLLAFAAIAPAQPSKVFDSYWSFAAERQAVFFRRLSGLPPPWTTDAVLKAYKFTNAYRASDRVSQYLIRNVIYQGDQSPEELFFRIILFKFFNRIETWHRLLDAFGEVRFDGYSFKAYDTVLSQALTSGHRIYSAAYIMPTGGRAFGTGRKHQANLRLLERMMDDEVPLRLSEMRTMASAFALLRSYPLIGDFLAYQYVTDINYSNLTDFSESEFVMPGPGARDGLTKCFTSFGGLSEVDLMKVVADRQEEEFAARGIDFSTLWGRRLQLIDCQNLFCEVDKYARVKHPDVAGRQARLRIKQKFSPTREPISYWYPPKWGINQRMSAGVL